MSDTFKALLIEKTDDGQAVSEHQLTVEDLMEAVTLMAKGGIENPTRDPLLATVVELTDDEIAQIVAFLGALATTEAFEAPKLPE